jgi:hypothetical protein
MKVRARAGHGKLRSVPGSLGKGPGIRVAAPLAGVQLAGAPAQISMADQLAIAVMNGDQGT